MTASESTNSKTATEQAEANAGTPLFNVGRHRHRDRGFWRDTSKDAWLAALTVAQPLFVFGSAWAWGRAALIGRVASVLALAVLAYWNAVIVAHLLTHRTWFRSARLNRLSEILSSLNAIQSIEAYRIYHRNHHAFNNDPPDAEGNTRDESSTFRYRKDGEHLNVFVYGVLGALGVALHHLFTFVSVHRAFGVHPHEELLVRDATARQRHNVRVERIACLVYLVALAFINWQYLVYCVIPIWLFCVMSLNVSNYYSHYGAKHDDRFAVAVSCYSPLYNKLTFNDGHHQEHHMAPGAHWTTWGDIRKRFPELDRHERIISRWPSIVGFLDRGRPMLHRSHRGTTGASEGSAAP